MLLLNHQKHGELSTQYLFPFHSWENRNTEKLNKLPMVTQLVGGQTRDDIHIVLDVE